MENNILKASWRANTQKTYDSLYKGWIKGRTTEEVATRLIQSPLSPRTKVSILRLLKKDRPSEFHSELENLLKYCSKNSNSDIVKAVTKTEASHLMAICKKKYAKFYPILLLALHGGLRRGEIFGLTWGDVDFLKGYIYVKRSYDGPTKNGRSRKIPLSKELEKSLQNCYNFTERENTKLFSNINPNPTLAAICKEANIPRITIHQLRHTFATLALEADTSPKQVQAILGHSNVSVTLNLYWQNIHEKVNLDFLP